MDRDLGKEILAHTQILVFIRMKSTLLSLTKATKTHVLLLLYLYTSHGGCDSYIITKYVIWLLMVWTRLKNNSSSKCLDMLTWKHLGRMWCLTSVFVIFNGLVVIEGKRMLSTRYCHCKIHGRWALKDIKIPQWKTCVVSIPILFIALKLNISFILHVLRFEGIILAIKVVYDLEVLVQIDTACARVYTLDLSSSSQQLGPLFPFVRQSGHAHPLK